MTACAGVDGEGGRPRQHARGGGRWEVKRDPLFQALVILKVKIWVSHLVQTRLPHQVCGLGEATQLL